MQGTFTAWNLPWRKQASLCRVRERSVTHLETLEEGCDVTPSGLGHRLFMDYRFTPEANTVPASSQIPFSLLNRSTTS